MKRPSELDLAAQLRTAFLGSGLSIKRLADRAGVPYASAHGFVTSDRDIALSTASRIAEVLGLELMPSDKPERK